MDVQIYLKKEPTFRALIEPFQHIHFDLAGVIQTDAMGEEALEHAYLRSQNIEAAWNPAKPCRSASVGDVFKLAEHYYVVAPVGFTLLPAPTPNALLTGL